MAQDRKKALDDKTRKLVSGRIENGKEHAAYQETKNIREVARQFHCDVSTVKHACLANGFNKNDFVKIAESQTHKQVKQLDRSTKEVLRSFPSINAAARWLLENASNKKPKTFDAAKVSIHRACTGKRPTAYGYKWEFANN